MHFCYSDLKAALSVFVAKEEQRFHAERAKHAVQRLKRGDFDCRSLSEKWSRAFVKVSSILRFSFR